MSIVYFPSNWVIMYDSRNKEISLAPKYKTGNRCPTLFC